MDTADLILQELQHINHKVDALTDKVGTLTGKVDELSDKVDELAEQEEITRSGVNKLIEWAEGVGTAFQIPFAEAKE